MVTVLSVDLLSRFSVIFSVLLVFVVVYAVIVKTKIFGDGKEGLAGLIALCIALLVAVSKASDLIIFMAPWFTVLLFFLLFIFMISMFAGVVSAETTAERIGSM